MGGWYSLHLLICFFYLPCLNIISLTSPKITLAFLFFLLFVKIELYFYLKKNWSSQNQSSRTVFAGPAMTSLMSNIIWHTVSPLACLSPSNYLLLAKITLLGDQHQPTCSSLVLLEFQWCCVVVLPLKCILHHLL